ncbi:MAG: RimK family alpha-L-glutamate ligase [Woeseia sp.]
MPKIYVIHENKEWTEPLNAELRSLGLPFEEWYLDRGRLDLSVPPPLGVFYNRMSASSHTRDHRYAAEYTAAVLAWLESHGRRVVNSGRALQLEMSKVAQYAALAAHGIRIPRTIVAVGREEIFAAARGFYGRFITKHNRGGKGLGVRLFQDIDALRKHVDGPGFEAPIDGLMLLQQYIEAPKPYITRCEFIGGEFLYAVRADTSDGFLLCPADECKPEDAYSPTASRFRIVNNFDHPILARYRAFLDSNDIHIAGIEFILDKDRNLYTYDVNTNTNYNALAEAEAGISGMRRIAEYLGDQLAEVGEYDCKQKAAAN